MDVDLTLPSSYYLMDTTYLKAFHSEVRLVVLLRLKAVHSAWS